MITGSGRWVEAATAVQQAATPLRTNPLTFKSSNGMGPSNVERHARGAQSGNLNA